MAPSRLVIGPAALSPIVLAQAAGGMLSAESGRTGARSPSGRSPAGCPAVPTGSDGEAPASTDPGSATGCRCCPRRWSSVTLGCFAGGASRVPNSSRMSAGSFLTLSVQSDVITLSRGAAIVPTALATVGPKERRTSPGSTRA